FDETMRELALRRYTEFEGELGPVLTRYVIDETLARMQEGGHLAGLSPEDRDRAADELTARLAPEEGSGLARHPAIASVTEVQRRVAESLTAIGVLADPAAALELQESPLARAAGAAREAFGGEHRTLAGEVLKALEGRRLALWGERVKRVNGELFD